MKKYKIIKIREHKELKQQSAEWFHHRWGIPQETYIDSIEECVRNSSSVPQWYVILDGQAIIAGIGVIENDFHNRKDLTPNVCAVYVDKAYRNQGIAGDMIQYVCEDFKEKGIDTLYLITNHTSFYERYGWEFLCMVQVDEEPEMIRMYVHKM